MEKDTINITDNRVTKLAGYDICRYRLFLKTLYELKNDYSFYADEKSLKPMTKNEIKNFLENLRFNVPYSIICLVKDNKQYDEKRFSLVTELKDLKMVDEINPITVWYQTMFDLTKQWGIKNIPTIDPTTVYIDLDMKSDWAANHAKMFPYQLMTRINSVNDQINSDEHIYKLSEKAIDSVLESSDNENIYCIIQ